jgi:hypothetical protein
MDSLDELTKTTTTNKTGFVKHVFNFDDDSKAEILNIIQYTFLAIIPVIIVNKLTQRFVPEADDEKRSVEIVFEVLAQIVVMFLFILMIHRIIIYIPTYSGEKYPSFSVTNIILAMLVILLSLQTKLGEKVSILVDRVTELWDGKTDTNKKDGKKKGKASVKVSQPISQNPSYPSQNQMAMNQSLSSIGSTSISSLPPPASSGPQQSLPDYNDMYQQEPTPLIGAASPGMDMMTEPMAANSGGMSAFGGIW